MAHLYVDAYWRTWTTIAFFAVCVFASCCVSGMYHNFLQGRAILGDPMQAPLQKVTGYKKDLPQFSAAVAFVVAVSALSLIAMGRAVCLFAPPPLPPPIIVTPRVEGSRSLWGKGGEGEGGGRGVSSFLLCCFHSIFFTLSSKISRTPRTQATSNHILVKLPVVFCATFVWVCTGFFMLSVFVDRNRSYLHNTALAPFLEDVVKKLR